MTAARLQLPGLYDGDCEVLAAHLDGSWWVQFPKTGARCTVPAGDVTCSDPPAPANPYGLTATQIVVLMAFAAATNGGLDGLADHEHTTPNVADHRRTLEGKGLVARRQGIYHTTDRGTPGHVWAITSTGRDALRPSHPDPAAIAATDTITKAL